MGTRAFKAVDWVPRAVAGADTGGDRAAGVYSLIGSGKLQSIDPELSLRCVLRHIAAATYGVFIVFVLDEQVDRVAGNSVIIEWLQFNLRWASSVQSFEISDDRPRSLFSRRFAARRWLGVANG